MGELLTKESTLERFPPRKEAFPYRREQVLVGFAEKAFMVSRNDEGKIVYAISADAYERTVLPELIMSRSVKSEVIE